MFYGKKKGYNKFRNKKYKIAQVNIWGQEVVVLVAHYGPILLKPLLWGCWGKIKLCAVQKGCNNLPNLNALQLTEKEKACLINFNPEQQRRVAQRAPKQLTCYMQKLPSETLIYKGKTEINRIFLYGTC